MSSFDSMTRIPFPEMFSPNQFPAALSDARIQLGRTEEKMGLTGLERAFLALELFPATGPVPFVYFQF